MTILERRLKRHLSKSFLLLRKTIKFSAFDAFAVEQIDVSFHNVIISSSHAVSKGVLTGPDQLHISYVHSPMRYAWDLQHQYLKKLVSAKV